MVLQLLVYAVLQVPVGMLLDRFGARLLVAAGALTMAAGQLLLAAAGSVPLAVAARVPVGAGDALTFISVLSVVSAWFPPRRTPITQLTGLVGQLGQALSAPPFAALLHGPAGPPRSPRRRARYRRGRRRARRAARSPARVSAPPPARRRGGCWPGWSTRGANRTRLGLWTHLGTQFSGTVFALLWGVPYLVAGQGLAPAAASALLTAFVLVGIPAGPLFGVFTARHPLRRSWLVLAGSG